ncbi:OmpA family protein [Arachidicoccus terrestris]|uniref:OmpA family protein n=1 Tax=Arachidicoccus terrestris TaxID=2875539 RepID=UPI001CC4A34E|nr:OmpA family protein [Arachidicoccus terrestris]UAY56775.1 OmpA family protein [Arachidicoccus terrestris]
MASKKYTMMLGLLGLISTAAFAQDTSTTTSESVSTQGTSISAGTNADDSWIYDGTNKVRVTKEDQQNGFLNHTNPYPAKPRNMMELGIGLGPSFLFSPIDPRFGYGASISLRKALGHTFSVRLGYGASNNFGLDYRTRNASDTKNSKIIAAYGKSNNNYLANYKTFIQQASLDLIADLNSLSHYRGNPKTSFYALVGYSFNMANVAINAFQKDGSIYDWSSLPGGSRKDIKDYAKDQLSKDQSNGILDVKGKDDMNRQYETAGVERNGTRDDAVGSEKTINRHGLDAGLGVAFKVSPRFNIGIEQKFTMFFNNSDVLAGLVLQKQGRNTTLSSTQVRFNFNLGNSDKRIEPLWWVNPNNYAYNKLATRDVLPDADGDGVTDQFDQEPNTPAGCAVDTHGRSLDTDGDGVPDCRDKQVLTPQSWFPVDADGVGTEPEPACCQELRDKLASMPAQAECAITSLPSVNFSGSSIKLDDAAQSALTSAAAQLNSNPNCKVKIVGYGASNKRAQQLSWDRVNAVKNFLIEQQGISEGRIIFTYGYDGDANTVDLQPTTESGPSTVPAPHPNLQK